MKIENEIHQTKFKNEHHKLLVNIIFTNNWLTNTNKVIFDNSDITMQQYNILRILRGSINGLSTCEIRERMLDKMSDTSRLVDRLCKKELTKKKQNTTDKRLVSVSITNKGLLLLAKLDEQEDNMLLTLSNLTNNEATQLNTLLDKLRNKENQ